MHSLIGELSLWKARTKCHCCCFADIHGLIQKLFFKCCSTCCLSTKPVVSLFTDASFFQRVKEYFSYIVFSILVIIYSCVPFVYFVSVCLSHGRTPLNVCSSFCLLIRRDINIISKEVIVLKPLNGII